MTGECIFCQIANGMVPAVKIWEDQDHIAFLDNNPIVEGQTLVIPKGHFESYILDMPRVEYKDLMLAAKKAGKYLDRGLRADRILMVVEGLEIDHAHVKLYPMVKDSGFSGLGIKPGVAKTAEELEQVAGKIRGNNK